MAKKSNKKSRKAIVPEQVGINRTKLRPALRANICKWLAYGVSVECAAESEGVHAATFYTWLRRGRIALESAAMQWDEQHPGVDPDEAELIALIEPAQLEFVHLVSEVQRAYARAEGGYTKLVWRHSQKDWRAAAFWLERRRPQHYGRRTELHVDHDDLSSRSTEDLSAELKAALQSLGFVQAAVVQARPSANDNAAAPSPYGSVLPALMGDHDHGQGNGHGASGSHGAGRHSNGTGNGSGGNGHG